MKLVGQLRTRWIVWVWNHTPTCAEMSRLASLSFEQPPSLKLRFRMWLHHLICVWCERYWKHLHFLHGAARQFPSQPDPFSNRRLSDEAKRRMARRLRAARDH